MQKTKLGISVGLLGLIIYFGSLFGGYVAAVILFGYVLLFEENPWLRKTAVKSMTLLVTFSLLSAIIGLIPDFISFINTVFNVFGSSFYLPTVSSIISVFTVALTILKTVIYIVLGLKALNQGTIAIPVVDKLINKYMG